MTKLGKRQHQKRVSSPSTWPIHRKGTKWVPKILPGAHSKNYGMPLLILLRDALKIADTRKEIKYIISSQKVTVDGRTRGNEKLPVGHMDVVQIPSMEKAYRIQLHSSHKLHAKEIETSDASYKICKIVGKRNIRGGNTQISLHDGRNILLPNDDERLSNLTPQSSVKITVPDQEIVEIYALEEGARAMVTEGRHQGKIGLIREINKRYGPKASGVIFEDEETDGETFRTALDYVFVVSDLELDR